MKEPWIKFTFVTNIEITFFDVVLWMPSTSPIQAWVSNDDESRRGCTEKRVIESADTTIGGGPIVDVENGILISIRFTCHQSSVKEIGIKVLGETQDTEISLAEVRIFSATFYG